MKPRDCHIENKATDTINIVLSAFDGRDRFFSDEQIMCHFKYSTRKELWGRISLFPFVK